MAHEEPQTTDHLAQSAKTQPRPVATLMVGLLAGALIGTAAVNAKGDDLRPNRTSDLSQLAADQETRNEDLLSRAADLRTQNDQKVANQGVAPAAPQHESETAAIAGLAAVRGPALQVTLTDAPRHIEPAGVDADLLVVHEQDIQAVVNVLWAGGAEAMTIQGIRAISTTAVKCVGNSIVLDGVPYAPPYQIVAIGDVAKLEAELAESEAIQVYQQYVQAYGLGFAQTRIDEVEMPAYEGALPQQATAVGE